MRRRKGFCALLAGLFAALLASPAPAAEITVALTSDQFGTPFGQAPICSLREAVQASNTNSDYDGCVRVGPGNADTILIEAGETYSRSRGGVDDTNELGDLDITGNTTLEVVGPGSATIDANDLDRVIQVHDGARLTASRVVIQDGTVGAGSPDNSGGGIMVEDGRLQLRSSSVLDNVVPGIATCGCGGGIAAGGETVLKRVEVRGNSAKAGGGIFFTTGELKVSRSTIAGNFAEQGGGIKFNAQDGAVANVTQSTFADNEALLGTEGQGGAIHSLGFNDHRLQVTNSTLSRNLANGHGGGIFELDGKLKLNALTITNNIANYNEDANGDGGGLAAETGERLGVKNSIIAMNDDAAVGNQDCFLELQDPAHNLVGIGTGCVQTGSNVAAADPLLKPLGDFGGTTETHALRRQSPAIAEAAGSAPAKDQRGVRRDGQPDIGAYER
jgi:hypothetical protein